MSTNLPGNDTEETSNGTGQTGGADSADPGSGAADRTVLDGPARENEEMRRGTEDLRSSEGKIAQAREFADEVARRTEPEPTTRPDTPSS